MIMNRKQKDELYERLAQSKRVSTQHNFWLTQRYHKQPYDAEHDARMAWWREARLGLFLHFGLYSLLGRNEWVMNLEMMTPEEYEPLADRFKPEPGKIREAVRLAADTGMRYAIMGAKHHDGFCLWDTKQTDFNSVQRAAQLDLMKEFTDACHEFGLRCGIYYSLMDWRHPDGYACKNDEAARRRFVDFSWGCIQELLSNYGKIDILWLDVPSPLSPEQWGAEEMIAQARALQPGLLVNDRFGIPGDFASPEEGVVVAEPGRDWEVAMTANHGWGYSEGAEQDWRSIREVLRILHQACAHQGNFLLNLGPKPDGSLPEKSYEIFGQLKHWLEKNGETVFGDFDRLEEYKPWRNGTSSWVIKDEKTVYLWNYWWQPGQLRVGGILTAPSKVTLLATGAACAFKHDGKRVTLTGLPPTDPSPETGFNVFRLDFPEPVKFANPSMIEW